MIGLFSGKKLKIIIRTEKQYHFYRTGSAGRLLFILTWEDGLQGSRKHTVPVLAPWGGGGHRYLSSSVGAYLMLGEGCTGLGK